MTSLFDTQYKRLNKGQKEAVDAIEGPVMVIAGPGTGKTTILTLRIARILQKTDTPPSGLLALTFTDSGVKAMKTKLRGLIGSRADEVGIFTYHSFASSIITQYREHFPHCAQAEQLSDIEAELYIRDILRTKEYAPLRPLGEPDLYIGVILKTISEAKREAWTPLMIKDFATEEIKRIKEDPASLSTRGTTKGQLKAEVLKRIERCEKTILFSSVYETYEQKKKEEKKLDFDDLIFELMLGMKHDSLLKSLVQEKYLYVLVDEHQDTNNSQNEIIQSIVDFFDTPNLFVVGDEKQAIYRFQGASVAKFVRFEHMWGGMKVISLTDNYRSHQSILDASFSMIEHNYTDTEHAPARIRLVSGTSSASRPLEVISAGNMWALEERLMRELQSIVEHHPHKTVAIIVRTNKNVERVLALCEEKGIPVSAERGINIFKHPVGILFFDLALYFSDISQVESLSRTIALGLWDISFDTRTALIQKIRSGAVSECVKEIPVLDVLWKELLQSTPLGFIVRLGALSGLVSKTTNDPVSSEVWRSIVSLTSDIASRKNIQDVGTLLVELCAYKKSADTRTIKVATGKVSAQIEVMTAHSAKGLEYDYVFIPYATEESWMSRAHGPSFVLPQEKNEGDEVRDARRLFYVAITRAREHVCILIPQARETGQELTPLRFVSELHSDHVSTVEIPSVQNVPTARNLETLSSDRKTALQEYAKRILLEKGLSVTALNHFMKCPQTFFYKSILKVPEAPHPSSEKGNAMHKAFSAVWNSTDRSVQSITDTIVLSVQEYFAHSLLPVFEKEMALLELTKNAPIVAKALHEHFASVEKALSENWYERILEVTYDGAVIPLKLHGRMDAVVEMGNSVFVYDYKTREAMSTTAIRGETKNSDGAYFRQLVFYKILLASHPSYISKSIEPALVFVKPDDKGRCPIISLPIEKADVSVALSEIESLVQAVWSGTLFDSHCDDAECEWCSFKKHLA